MEHETDEAGGTVPLGPDDILLGIGGLDWLVLDVREGKAFLIATDVVESRRFDTALNSWGSSGIRKWLNGEFLSRFSADEQQAIIAVSLQDADTSDKVFLLSDQEAEDFFRDDVYRVAMLDGEPASWWLRSEGVAEDVAAAVDPEGQIDYWDCAVYDNSVGVRPAMWLDSTAAGI